MHKRPISYLLVLAAALIAEAPALAQANLSVVHAAYGIDDSFDTRQPVDIRIDGICTQNVVYGQTVGPLNMPPGKVVVTAWEAESGCLGTSLGKDQEVRLKSGDDIDMVVHPDEEGELTSTLFDNAPMLGDTARKPTTLAVRHVAATSRLDVDLTNRNAVLDTGSVKNGKELAPVVLEHGRYGLEVWLDEELVAGPLHGKLKPRKAYFVYIAGSESDVTLLGITRNRRDGDGTTPAITPIGDILDGTVQAGNVTIQGTVTADTSDNDEKMVTDATGTVQVDFPGSNFPMVGDKVRIFGSISSSEIDASFWQKIQ